MEHTFGGDWTEEKLERLRGYLVAYRAIFQSNVHAQYFVTWYVDAFAGTGSRVKPQSASSQSFPLLAEDELNEDQTQLFEGSASIALALASPFHKYLFIESSKKRADALMEMVQRDFPALADRVEIRIGDANKELCDWCSARDWHRERAVVFLDPYGMQVEWNTVESLAKTQGVDLWYLFPFVQRLLRNDQNIDERWIKRLDILFGTTDWHKRFYQTETQNTLFGPVESTIRDATVNNVQGFIEERLKSCFIAVANSRILSNSKSSPLFALCFAASNKKGSATALKIAQHLLGVKDFNGD